MKTVKVNSSTIDSIGYDYENHNLYVNFTNGREYIYGNVPTETYAKFLEADSKGKFLNAEIVGKFSYVRIK